MDMKEIYVLYYSPEREEVESITLVTDDDNYDFNGKDKDELLEKLRDDIENDSCINVYSSDCFYNGLCNDTWIASFKTYDDAKVFADNTDKDVVIARWFEKNEQEQ